MTQAVPTLSTAGFVTDMPSMIDRMFSYYLTSDYSQSNLFEGKILSLQKQVQAYQHDRTMLVSNIRDELEGYFNSVADSSTVKVSLDDPNPDDPSRINITLEAMVIKNGKAYSVGKLIETQDSKILKIIHLNNEGTFA
jgi:hypothetical protein